MSTLYIEIAEEELTSQYQTGSLTITEHKSKSNTASFRMSVSPAGTTPQIGSFVYITDSARTPDTLFAGYVTRIRPVEYGVGSFFVYDIEATDRTYIFNNRLAARDYTGQTLGDIATDLIDSYAPDVGFGTSNIANGPVIPSISFNYVTLRRAFEELAKLTGYIWRIDYNTEVYFQPPAFAPAPESFRDSAPHNHVSVSIDADVTQVRNNVTVIGSDDGEPSANIDTQTFIADGTTRSWQLDNKPDSIVSITVDGVSKQFSLDVNQQTTDDFVYSFSGASISVAAGGSVPTNGQVIEVIYYPRVTIIANVQDAASIEFFKVYESSDGLHDYLITDKNIKTKAQARDRATQELAQFATPLITGKVVTRSDLLSPGSIFRPGQALTVNLPSWGITTDTAYTIQQVVTRLNEDGSNIIYSYEITFGGKPVGVQEFLESLVPQGGVANTTIEVFKTAGVDVAVASDSTPTMNTYTPPFRYGPGGSPQGKYNLSEWG